MSYKSWSDGLDDQLMSTVKGNAELSGAARGVVAHRSSIEIDSLRSTALVGAPSLPPHSSARALSARHGVLVQYISPLTMHQTLSLSFIDYPLNLNPSSLVTCPSLNLLPVEPFINLAHNVLADDPQKVVKVIASNGKTGEQCELSYTNCKVVGNGSFGVVFQAKLVNGSLADDGGDDAVAIKKVLQDKRFKVRDYPLCCSFSRFEAELRCDRARALHAPTAT